MKRFVLSLLVVLMPALPAWADWIPDAADRLQVDARAALDRLRGEHGDALNPYFDEAWGYALFPRVRGGGMVLGWNGGRGVVIEQDSYVGQVRQRRLSVGAQWGYQSEIQIIFFRDAETLAAFKEGHLEFTPQLSANLGTLGAAANTGFSPRVAVFSTIAGGLMFELGLGATRFRFTPAQQ